MDERIWTNTSPEPGERADYPGLTVTCDAPGGAQMISGDLEAALAVLAPGAPVLGCGAPAPQGPHAIHVARDRAILVTPAAPGGAVRLAWQHAPLRSRSLPGWARIWPAPERRWRSAFRPRRGLSLVLPSQSGRGLKPGHCGGHWASARDFQPISPRTAGLGLASPRRDT